MTTYQEKLNDLDVKQQDLLKENIDLKELCLMLDQEREGENDGHTSKPQKNLMSWKDVSGMVIFQF